jgi:L-lactate dehydrogenase
MQISEKSVDVSVIGQQGEGQIVAWSKASIGGVPVADVMPAAAWLDRPKLEEQCKARTQRILQAKGSTPFGISSVVASLCSSIVLDKRKIRSVSHFQPDLGCCLSSPAVIGRKGIVESINTALEEEEMTKLHDSAKALVHMMNSLQQD